MFPMAYRPGQKIARVQRADHGRNLDKLSPEKAVFCNFALTLTLMNQTDKRAFEMAGCRGELIATQSAIPFRICLAGGEVKDFFGSGSDSDGWSSSVPFDASRSLV